MSDEPTATGSLSALGLGASSPDSCPLLLPPSTKAVLLETDNQAGWEHECHREFGIKNTYASEMMKILDQEIHHEGNTSPTG